MATTARKNRAAKTAATPAKTADAPAKATPKGPYRDHPDFVETVKAACKITKKTPVFAPVQLIRHLAWKTPTGTVGWDKGTTPDVVATANDLAVPTGTAIPEALEVALGTARKAALGDDALEAAVEALATVIKEHEA